MRAGRQRWLIVSVLALQGALVAAVAALSQSGAPPSRVVIALATMFVPYAVLVRTCESSDEFIGPRFAAALCAVFGLLWVWAPPVLSDDLYRYLWEGRLWLDGVNPYRVPPSDPSLVPLRDALWEPINNKPLASIYPPLMQLLFVLSALLGGQVWTLKCLALVGLLGAVLAVARVTGRSGPALALGLNPLMLSETALNGHFDVLVGAMLLLAVWSLAENRFIQAGLATCAAVGLKLVGIVVLPLFGRRREAVFVAVCALGLFLVPILGSAGPASPVSGLGQFATRWQGNDSLFGIINFFTHLLADDPVAGFVARATAAMLFLALTGVVLRRRLSPLGAARTLVWGLLLLSPQVHPWYLGWLLPLELAAGGRAALVWSALVLAAYVPLDRWLSDGIWHMPLGVQLAEYGLLGLALLSDPRRPSLSEPALSPSSG
jgi:hypothetical protein